MVVPDCHFPQNNVGKYGPQIKPGRFRLYTRSTFSLKAYRTLEYTLSKKSMAVLLLDPKDFLNI